MPIKSYLVFPHSGQKEQLAQALEHHACSVIPAENKDLLIMVTDTQSEQDEEGLMQQLKEIKSLDHYTLVSGFND